MTQSVENSYKKGSSHTDTMLLEDLLSADTPFPSYRDLPPLESGGVIARIGFEFQDHVAAKYCIEMLQNANLREVWCESLDDITLIRLYGDQEEFEFVQVKSNELSHFWSIAELCKRDKKGKIIGSSILEKSLAYERGSEPCRFRMVTKLPVNSELKILTLPLDSSRRISLNNLCKKVSEKIPDYISPKGSNVSSWLSRLVWEVCESSEALKNANFLNLRRVSSDLGMFLAEDQWDEMYRKILQKVQDAGGAKWEVNPEAKKLKRDEFLIWFQDSIAKAQSPGIGGTGRKLHEKMERAGIAPDLIEVAQEQRMSYRQNVLTPGYMDLSKRQDIERNTQAHLHELLAELDAGKCNDTGIEFHSRCLGCLSEVQQHDNGNTSLSLSFLQGYMYSLADRCVHRFTRTAI